MPVSRIRTLRAQLKKHGLDGMLIAYAPNVHYATTNFNGSNGLCVLTQTQAHFLSDFRYKEQSRMQVDKGWKITIPEGGALYKTVAEKKYLGSAKRVGFEAEHVSVAQLAHLKKALKGVTLVPVDGFVEMCALVKEPWEVSNIKKAATISAMTFNEIIPLLRPGVREREIAAAITYYHRMFGAEGDAFETIIASGERGAFVHGRASERKLRNKELVTIDFGCVVDGYSCDITRTVALGKISNDMRRVYEIVLEAQERSMEFVHAGVDAKALDSVARDFLSAFGFTKEFGHSLGHGLGLQVHERPRVSQQGAGFAIPENACITIEPGVYLPNKFGIRIEDDIRVTKSGFELLTPHIPRELITL